MKNLDPEDEAFEELSLKQGQWQHTSGWRKKQILETSMTQEALADHAMSKVQRLGQEIEQEPVAWPCLIDSADFSENTITLVMQCEDYKVSAGTHYLSTTPPQRTWVGLTKNERLELYRQFENCLESDDCEYEKAIEQALKERNQ